MSEGWRKEKAFNNTNHNIEIRRHKNIDLSLHQSTIAASSSTTSIFAISCGKQDDGIFSGSASTVALRGFCTAPVDLWAKDLTTSNLYSTLLKFQQVVATTCVVSKRQVEVGFLSLLFQHCLSKSSTNQANDKPTSDLQLTAVKCVVRIVASQPDFATVICTSLRSVYPKGDTARFDRDKLVQTLLDHFFIATVDWSSESQLSLDRLTAVTLATAVVSGYKVLELSQQSNSYLLAEQQLSVFASNNCISLTSALRQVLLGTISIENSELKSIIIQTNLNKMSTHSNNSKNPSMSSIGMSEQLSPTGQNLGMGIINLLADLGPSCTSSTSTLRDTLMNITKTNSKNAALDERAVAHLIYFFSERGTRKHMNENGAGASSTLVQTFTDNHGATGNNWNLSAVQEVISQDYANLSWDHVAEGFDFDGFIIRDLVHFNVFLTLYSAAAKKNFPFEVLASRWKNKLGQLSFIKSSLCVSPSVYQFPLTHDENIDASTAGDTSPTSILNPRGFACANILVNLLEMSDSGVDNFNRVKEVLSEGLRDCPEVLICALFRFRMLHSKQTLSNVGMQMQNLLTMELLSRFFKPNRNLVIKNAPAAIRRLWAIDNNIVIGGCIEGWKTTANESPQSRLETIIHVIGIIRNLPETATATILNGNTNNEFSISIAFIMADIELLQLRAWLNSRMSATNGGIKFINALINYIGMNVSTSLQRATTRNNNNEGKGGPLVSIENMLLAIQILRMLDASFLGQDISNGSESQPQTLGDRVKLLIERCVSQHPSLAPKLMEQQNNQSVNTVQQNSSVSSDDIEEMANSYFQKIYTSEQSIDEVVEMLKRFKTSGTPRENDIFACMIHNLFDEYRFFSKYPEKELRITGILFGKLIQHQLVSSITLGIALRYVLEALRKPPGPVSATTSNSGKMFRFGMFALEQFKSRLNEWPQYCSHIVQIPHLKDGYKSLVEEIEGAMVETQNRNSSNVSLGSTASGSISEISAKGGNVPSTVDVEVLNEERTALSSATSMIGSSSNSLVVPIKKEAKFGPGLGRAVNGKEEDVQHEAPPDAVLDRVQFLINNVTMSNVESKSADLKGLLEPQYFGWLGNYLVVKRISTQPNFHSVYLAFLERLGDYGRGLIDAILCSVYLNVGKLLRSPKITTSTSERSLLKNLGSWLGQITLARNKPILQITLDCKELLYQGYETGMLIAVTPFVAKILEGAKNSIVFRPPNPWVMGLLSVFRALYGVDDLKMNIKFEVEVLCKNLGVKLEDILLRADDLAKRIAPVKTRNPDFNIKSTVSSQSPAPNSASMISNVPGKQASTGLPSAGININPKSLQMKSPTTSTQDQKQQQTVIPNLASYVSINPNLVQLFQQLAASGTASNISSATLKQNVPIAVDRAIREIIQPVVERSVTIACITTKEIVVKDFAMESDENKLMKAAQLMVANLAGSLALVTCREPLRASVATHLRQLLISSALGGSAESASAQIPKDLQDVIDECVENCSNDNLELGCTLIEKAATEKAVRDMEDAIAPAIQMRKNNREQTGQPFYDMSIFNNGYQYPSGLPEPLLPKPGGLRNEQLRVYEAFQRIPRQPSVTSQQQNSNGPANDSNQITSEVSGQGQKLPPKVNMEAFTRIALKLESSITSLLTNNKDRAAEITLNRLPANHEIKHLIVVSKQMTSSIASAGTMTSSEQDSILGFAQNIFKRLYELRLSEPLRLEAFVGLLEALNECCRQLSKDIGTWATYAPTDTDVQRKLHRTVLLLLLRSDLLQVIELDSYLFDRIDQGRNMIWLEFTMAFIRTALLEKIVNPKDLPKVMNLLMSLRSGSSMSNQISQLLSMIQESTNTVPKAEEKGRVTPDNVAATVSGLNALVGKPDKPTYSSISVDSLNNFAGATRRALESTKSIAAKDPSNLAQQVSRLLDGWMRLNAGDGIDKNTVQYVQLLQQSGIGKSEEQTERFFRVSTEILVVSVLQNASIDESKSQELNQLNYAVIDSYGKLVSVLVRHLNVGGSTDEIANQRISLLNQILGVTMRTMMADYEKAKQNKTSWDQRPWFRLLLNLVMDLNAPSSTLDAINYGILSVFGSAFHVVQPLVIPGFAFAWLELVSHRMFLSNLLLVNNQKGWALAHQLLIDLFLFLEPHLRKTELTKSIRHLYKGTLRVLLVLLHDFPAFLSGYHLSFCNVIPENCVQLRNIVLSAFPRGMVLPDPFTPNLKIDLLPEISKPPVILSNVFGPLSEIREGLDAFLKTRQPSNFVDTLLPRLLKKGSKDVDCARVNSLVLYLGMHAISKMQTPQVPSLAHTAEIEVMQKLMDFDDRGRFTSLNAIANQLRYPSSHTHYFSCVMLFLFSEAKDEGVREQVTRVLLERLIVHRPHPWGLLITFIELIKNQRYQFWSHGFTRCATEIEKVFESVARSCMTPGTQKSTSIVGDTA